jgi:GNAT superfamily N-acetyltransferase
MDTPDLRWTTGDSLPADLHDAVDDGLDASNLAAEPRLAEVRALVVGVREGDAVRGGAIGRTWGACAELQQLWVDAAHRHRGLGSQLLHAFEAEAVARGATVFYLETFNFMAPDFYARHGYQAAATIEGFGPGIRKFLMHKSLPGGPPGVTRR